MHLAILHYHLNRGGVTSVIVNHLLALDRVVPPGERLHAAVLYGGRQSGWPDDVADRLRSIDLKLSVLPEIEYDSVRQSEDATATTPTELARVIRRRLDALGFPAGETVLHVHNHSLGKNAALPAALTNLATDGRPLLLQIHDFAEDFRPTNYQRLLERTNGEAPVDSLYTQASRIHYAVLNRRDFGVLQDAGVAADRLHFLPNPVLGVGNLPDRAAAREKLARATGVPPEERFTLYPVRGIRRKNVGEMLSWSIMAPGWFGLTLAPLNPAEIKHYNRWPALADELNLPCRFDVGNAGLTFHENLAAADLFLTTSVAEGFGMTFLEAWTAGKPLAGRNLPGVTADFKEAGVRFDALYDRLDVPIEWVGRERYTAAFRQAAEELLTSYRLDRPDDDEWRCILDSKIESDCVDFGDLNEDMQEDVVRRVHGESEARARFRELNPVFDSVDDGFNNEAVDANARVVEEIYGVEPSGRRLQSVYQALMSDPRDAEVEPGIDQRLILSALAELGSLRLLRT